REVDAERAELLALDLGDVGPEVAGGDAADERAVRGDSAHERLAETGLLVGLLPLLRRARDELVGHAVHVAGELGDLVAPLDRRARVLLAARDAARGRR